MTVLRLVCAGLVSWGDELTVVINEYKGKGMWPWPSLKVSNASLNLPLAYLSEGELGLCKRSELFG